MNNPNDRRVGGFYTPCPEKPVVVGYSRLTMQLDIEVCEMLKKHFPPKPNFILKFNEEGISAKAS